MLRNVGIALAFKPIQTIKTILPNTKDALNVEEKIGLIYEISCKNCKHSHYGDWSNSQKFKNTIKRTQAKLKKIGRLRSPHYINIQCKSIIS